MQNGGLIPTDEGHYFSISSIVVSPEGRGTITLKTSDPFDHPLIDPGLMNSEYDRFALREALNKSLRFVEGPAWQDYIVQPTLGLPNVMSDTELDKYIIESAGLSLH
ncbi:hypothetical protein H0H87_012131, partial [Tephrocybe sp. NHM501043]